MHMVRHLKLVFICYDPLDMLFNYNTAINPLSLFTPPIIIQL